MRAWVCAAGLLLAACSGGEGAGPAAPTQVTAEAPQFRLLVRRGGLSQVTDRVTPESLSLTLSDSDFRFYRGQLRELLDALGFNAPATMERMGNTRAIDGTLEAEGDDVVASWTYHPDDGLRIVFEATG